MLQSLELVRPTAVGGAGPSKTPRTKEGKPIKASAAPKVDVQVESPKPAEPESITVDEPETPLTDIEDPIPIARPMPRIKLRMPSKAAKPKEAEDAGSAVVEGSGSQAQDEQTMAEPTENLAVAETTSSRPRRAVASRPQPSSDNSTAQRPTRGNKRASQKPTSPPPTRTLRSRRGDKTEEEAQKEKEKAEAIRAALESGDDDDEDEMDVDEGI